MITWVRDWLIATVSAFILASLAHTQMVLHELSLLGVPIDFPTRLSTSIDDLIGLAPGYGAVVAVSLLLGFLIMLGINRWFNLPVQYRYPLGGFIAVLVAHLLMHPILDITLIAGARSPFGLLLQCLAGAFGGWVFSYARNRALP